MSVRSSDLPGPRSQSTYPSDAVDMIPLSTVELQRRSQDTPNLSFSDAALDDITGPLPFEAQDADNAEMADQNRSLTGNNTSPLTSSTNTAADTGYGLDPVENLSNIENMAMRSGNIASALGKIHENIAIAYLASILLPILTVTCYYVIVPTFSTYKMIRFAAAYYYQHDRISCPTLFDVINPLTPTSITYCKSGLVFMVTFSTTALFISAHSAWGSKEYCVRLYNIILPSYEAPILGYTQHNVLEATDRLTARHAESYAMTQIEALNNAKREFFRRYSHWPMWKLCMWFILWMTTATWMSFQTEWSSGSMPEYVYSFISTLCPIVTVLGAVASVFWAERVRNLRVPPPMSTQA